MNLTQAIERAHSMPLPGFMLDFEAMEVERRANEEAIGLLMSAYQEAERGYEPFPFTLVLDLADRNRELCDLYDNTDYLQTVSGGNLAAHLSQEDIVYGIAKIQHRSPKRVSTSAGIDLVSLGATITEAKVSGTVMGIDIETTSRVPERGYVINIGIAFMKLAKDARPHHGFSAYYSLPPIYDTKGIPLAEIHHISLSELEGRPRFRDEKKLHALLVKLMGKVPVMAHNASFEDSWFKLHIDGYAKARKAGKIALVDSREICRRIDPEVRNLPRESSPAALENWARRRGTLQADETERHLGLEDVFLMLDTVREEFRERNTLV